MQKITVEISAKGFVGLTAENIEKALSCYFFSPDLHVSFSVTEAAQQERAADEMSTCPDCNGKCYTMLKNGVRGVCKTCGSMGQVKASSYR